ncbi:hypothetical protein V8F20_010042 [Naviculisporaceae sp. PSN 640]
MGSQSGQIKMCIAGRRIKGYTDEKFTHEFSVIHAGITKASAQHTPAMLGYRQILAIPKPEISIFNNDNNNTDWDSQAILVWSSIDDLSALLKSEEYRANAGRHIFTEPPKLGSICQVAGELVFNTAECGDLSGKESAFMVFVYIPRANNRSLIPVTEQQISQRVDAIARVGAGSRKGLLKYVINRDIGPANPEEVFAGTPFITCDWGAMGATEQYWFRDEEAATAFFADEEVKEAILDTLPGSLDGKGLVAIAGRETVLVGKL